MITEDDILKQLKLCTKNNWLSEWAFREPILINKPTSKANCDSHKLYQLTIEKLEKLRLLSVNSQEKLKVLIAERDAIAFIASFLAGILAKIDIFLCNPSWQQHEWNYVLKLVQPDFIFAEPITQKSIAKFLSSDDRRSLSPPLFSEKSLIMIPTGGTSGKIKFAIHTWSSLTASVIGFCDYFQVKNVNSFCILPLYHVSGLMQLIRSFITKGSLYIIPYQAIKQQAKINLNIANFFISLVPTQLHFIVQSNPAWLSKFHTVLLGGAPTNESLLKLSRKYNIALAPTYGMTETAAQIVTLKPQDFLQGNNSNGRVLPHAQIKIINNQKQADTEREIGLISINAKSLFLGYYSQSLRRSTNFITDDLGYIDRDGYLYVVGRNSQKIISGGENIFPAEIETAILATKLVTDVCVIGVPNKQWGEVVTALYIPQQSDLNVAILAEKLRHKLSRYKIPKNWIQVNSIPRNDRGKINYHTVKKLARAHIDKMAKTQPANYDDGV